MDPRGVAGYYPLSVADFICFNSRQWIDLDDLNSFIDSASRTDPTVRASRLELNGELNGYLFLPRKHIHMPIDQIWFYIQEDPLRDLFIKLRSILNSRDDENPALVNRRPNTQTPKESKEEDLRLSFFYLIDKIRQFMSSHSTYYDQHRFDARFHWMENVDEDNLRLVTRLTHRFNTSLLVTLPGEDMIDRGAEIPRRAPRDNDRDDDAFGE